MKALCALIVVVALAGCVSSDSIRTGETEYAPRHHKHPIDVYLPDDAPVKLLKTAKDRKDPATIPAGSVQVGRIDIDGNKDAGWSNVLAEGKAVARKFGGDAIVMGSASTPVAGFGGAVMTDQSGSGFSWFGGSAKKGKAMTVTVIRYPEAVAPGEQK